MRLYRIKRKSDGMYCTLSIPRGPYVHSSRYWNSNGIFWRKIDTVVSKIKDLCSEFENERVYYEPFGCMFNEKRTSYKPELAENYCVEFIDVTVDKTEIIEATDLIPEFKRADHLRDKQVRIVP